MGKVVTICDHLFLEHTKSASIGGGNIGVGPTHFEWQYADAQTARFVTDSDIKHARGKGQVAWMLEPVSLHRENYLLAYERKDEFDAVLTHSLPEVFRSSYYPYGGSWIAFDQWGMHRKTKNISILLSKKNTMIGHRLRHRIAAEFGDYVDVFMGIPDKIEALAPYRFSIVIESESVVSYFTEKIVDCLCVGTIPIYWGDPYIGKYFDKDGIVPGYSMSQIWNAIEEAGEAKYESMLESVRRNIDHCRDWAICEDNIYAMYPELFE